MSGLSKFLRLRYGAKTNIVLGLIGVALGFYFAWGLTRVLSITHGNIPYGYLAAFSALALLLLGVGSWRIYLGCHSKEKHWWEDPLQRK